MLMYGIAVDIAFSAGQNAYSTQTFSFLFSLISNAAFILPYSNHQVVQAQTKNTITSTNRNIQLQNLSIAGRQK